MTDRIDRDLEALDARLDRPLDGRHASGAPRLAGWVIQAFVLAAIVMLVLDAPKAWAGLVLVGGVLAGSLGSLITRREA